MTRDARQREGQLPQPGLQRRAAADQLQVLRDEEQHAGEREDRQQVRAHGAGERGLAEQGDVHQGCREAALAADEQHGAGRADGLADDRRGRDAVSGELLEPVHHGDDAGERQLRAGRVEPARGGVPRLRQERDAMEPGPEGREVHAQALADDAVYDPAALEPGAVGPGHLIARCASSIRRWRGPPRRRGRAGVSW